MTAPTTTPTRTRRATECATPRKARPCIRRWCVAREQGGDDTVTTTGSSVCPTCRAADAKKREAARREQKIEKQRAAKAFREVRARQAERLRGRRAVAWHPPEGETSVMDRLAVLERRVGWLSAQLGVRSYAQRNSA